jgi:propanol-preferring alcohol dehydrogenase
MIPDTMQAWVVHEPGPLDTKPLRRVTRPVPRPGPGELLVRVLACGVCRTDLHLAEGDLPPKRPDVVPGHEAVGEVVLAGDGVPADVLGRRVGIAWVRGVCGACRWCRADAENLCPRSTYTGWDADGGYAGYAVVPVAFAHRLPDRYTDVEAAPLLCAGIVGYRALRRAELSAGGRLGVYGFGASAHVAAQIALDEGAKVHVVTRSARARELALDLGAASAQAPGEPLPERLDAAVLFAPSGELVPHALAALDRGGTLAIAGIHLSDVPQLSYERHLFYERSVRSVTASTRRDAREFLGAAARVRLRLATTMYPMAEADRALSDLATGALTGVAVLVPD